jgi:leader peptidase (prepilin peptidase)/N-methyltransferase
MLAPAWLANAHHAGHGWLWLRIALLLAVAVAAAVGSPMVLRALPVPTEDDGTPAADYRRLAGWRLLPAVAGLAAGVLAASVLWTVPWPLMPSVLAVAVAAPLLAYVDLRAHLLPDPVTLAASAVATVALATGCLATAHLRTLLAALGIGLATSALFVGAALVGGGLGLGDAKLVFVLSATATAVGLSGAVLLPVLALLLGGVTALFLVVTGRRDRKAHLPFGPALIAGWWLAVLWEGAALSALPVVAALSAG